MHLPRTSRLIILSAVALATLLSSSLIAPGKAEAAYDGSRIIDNSLFLNSKAMSRSQIQSFLSSKGAGLAKMSFKLDCYGQDSQEREWYTAVGAPCDQSVSAAHIIYYAAQIYGINPQVILATMQKEQSLVTAPNPTSWQVKQAMGYACPDSGNCGGSSTFPYQIDSGTWVLRYHYERANRNMTWWQTSTSWTCGTAKNYYKPSLYPGQNVTFYDDNNVAYRTYKLKNAASSTMYCYTPHAYNNPKGLYGRPKFGTKGQYYSGSYNFVSFFENWFGSTEGTPFFRIGDNPEVYILGSNNNYYYIPSRSTLEAYGFPSQNDRIASVGGSQISGMTYSGPLPVIARFEGGAVYLMDRGHRRHFTTREMLEDTYGFTIGQEATLPDNTAYFFPEYSPMAPVVTEYNGPSIYLIDSGQKHHFTEASTLGLGDPTYSALAQVNLSKTFIDKMSSGTPIFMPNRLLRAVDTGAYKFWNGTNLTQINSSVAKAAGVKPNFDVYAGQISSLTSLSTPVGKLALDSGGQRYLLDTGKKIPLSASQSTKLGFSDGSYVTAPDSFLRKIPSKSFTNLFQIDKKPEIYTVISGEVKRFASWKTINDAGYSPEQLMSLNSATASMLDFTGEVIYRAGSLVRVEGQQSVYLINSPTSKIYVPSSSLLKQYRMSIDWTMNVPSVSINDYPTVGTLGPLVKNSSGSLWHIYNGQYRRNLPDNLTVSSVYDIDPDTIPALPDRIIDDFNSQNSLGRAIRATGDSKIYYIQNGQKRWVTTKSALTGLGLSTSDARETNTKLINSIPTGSNIN